MTDTTTTLNAPHAERPEPAEDDRRARRAGVQAERHQRQRQRQPAGQRHRHPGADPDATPEPIAEPTDADADRAAFQALAGCVAGFVARLPSPYREAVTLVELEGLTIRAAADLAGVSVSGMKSRVQRGREKLRALFERCCEIALDARGKVTDVTPRACGAGC